MADNEKLGSTSPQVLLKNAINLDKLVNDRESESLPDRFDVLRRTWFGMEKAHDRQMQSQENRFDTFIASSGYEVIGDYTAGPLTFTEYNQIIRYNNELYKLTAATDTPFTTAGNTDETWTNSDAAHFVAVGDAALRQELMEGKALVGEMDARLITGDVTRSGAFVSFTFDDAYISALDVAAAFESRGLKTSFAFGMITPSRTATRLTWADVRDLAERGHEICNQGLTDSAIFSDTYNRALVNAEINQAYDMLREVGVECSGYHASRNSLGASFTDLLAQNHAYAFTVANQTAEGAAALQTYPINPYRMFRVSLYSLGLTKAKAAVDAAIANSGYVAFYDHDPSQQYYATSMSLADLNSLLDYCISKGVTVLPPAQVMTWLSGNLTQGRDVLTAVSQRKTD
ncbi:TPA: polysaccharide deacetylase family protein, partial [Klebsiella pneumoniae]|nr:polysaccharide deacetylase family protein [Klebsiella pneumoniae]